MSDPLDDPRAIDLLAARPDDVSALSVGFRAAAGESGQTATGLRAARSDGTWTGRAADAFRRAIGRLPVELDRVRAGYSAVAEALAAYEPELSRIQSAFERVIAERNDLRSRLAAAQTAAEAARGAFTWTGRTGSADRRSLAAAELASARADGSVALYRDEIARLTASAYALLDEFSAVRGACRDAVAAAQRTAPVRPEPGQGTTVIQAACL